VKDVFNVINDMVKDGIISTYAVGGAIAATFYVEPFATEDVDVFVHIAVETSMFMELAPIYEYLNNRGYKPHREQIRIENWDVQFLLIEDNSLLDEAVAQANIFDFDGVDVRVMMPEYLVAIMLSVGRAKDFARVKMFIEQQQVDIDSLLVLINRFELEEKWQRVKQL
jgi:hypothetical protein